MSLFSNVPIVENDSNPTTDLFMQIHIIKIDELNMMSMSATLMLEMTLTWRDSRLTFAHLAKNKTTLIPTEVETKLWLPTNDIYHDNAIVGQIMEDNHRSLSILGAKLRQPVNIGKDRETVLYKGSDNIIQEK